MNPEMTRYLNKLLRDNPDFTFNVGSSLSERKVTYQSCIFTEVPGEMDTLVVVGEPFVNIEKAIESMLRAYDKICANRDNVYPLRREFDV